MQRLIVMVMAFLVIGAYTCASNAVSAQPAETSVVESLDKTAASKLPEETSAVEPLDKTSASKLPEEIAVVEPLDKTAASKLPEKRALVEPLDKKAAVKPPKKTAVSNQTKEAELNKIKQLIAPFANDTIKKLSKLNLPVDSFEYKNEEKYKIEYKDGHLTIHIKIDLLQQTKNPAKNKRDLIIKLIKDLNSRTLIVDSFDYDEKAADLSFKFEDGHLSLSQITKWETDVIFQLIKMLKKQHHIVDSFVYNENKDLSFGFKDGKLEFSIKY